MQLRKPMLLAAISVIAMQSSAAFAQETDGRSAAEGGAGVEVGDIVVTAQRRAENMQRVPIAITAATGESLEAAGISSTVQIGTVAPSVNIRTNNGSFNPYIRGIGTSSNLVENPVALVIDGVYYPQQRDGLRDLLDIEQLAVLKGPQGTLFGRNATGGVIQITTKAPSFTFEGRAGAEIDNYATVRTSAYVTGPLSDSIAFSLSGQWGKQYEGYGRNFTTGNDTYQLKGLVDVRGKLLFKLSDDTSITLIGDYMNRRQNTSTSQPAAGTQFVLPGGSGPFTNRFDSYAGVDAYANYRGGGASMELEHDFGFAKFVSISAYRKGKGTTLIAPSNDPAASFIVTSPNYGNRMYSQEFQLVSPNGPFTWTAGAYYFNYRNGNYPITVIDRSAYSLVPFAFQRSDTSGSELAESIAPFGQLSWEFAPGTTLTAGARWTYEKRSLSGTRTLQLNGRTIVTTVNDSASFKEPTFRAALSHEFSQNFMAYASYNSGFKSGGFNANNVTQPAYLPEKLKAAEVGFKSQLFDRALRLNAAAYYYDYQNIQVTRFNGGTQTVENGAKAELYGIDLDLEARLTDSLRITGGLALQHAEFTDFPNATVVLPPAGPGQKFIFTNGNDVSGNRLPLSQKVSGSLAADYHVENVAGAKLDFNVTGFYSGDYYFEPDNGILHQPSFVNLNASMKITLPDDKLSVTIFGKNILDEHIFSFPNLNEYAANINYAPPLTYGVRVNYAF